MGALAEPLFRRYMIGNTLSLLGLWVQRVALGWLTWELTHSGFWLGAIAFADLFPTILIGPFAGVWADRRERRQLVAQMQAVSCVLALLLYLLVLSGTQNIYLIFLLVLGIGSSAAVAQPARLALIPGLVSKENLPAAVAMGSMAFNVSRFVGPMIAGAIIALADISLAFLFNALTYGAMAISVATMPAGETPGTKDAKVHILSDIAAGFRYTLGHTLIGRLMYIMIAVAVLAKPLADLLPGFADLVFDRGVVGLAIMTQAMGIGSLLGGLLMTRTQGMTRLWRIAFFSLLACGLTQLGFGQVSDFYVGLLILFFASMAITVAGISTQTMIQHVVQDNMRGRVLSIWGLIFRGGASLSLPLLGALADATHLGLTVSIAGGLCLLLSLPVIRTAPGLKD